LKQDYTTFPCGDILLEGVWHLPSSPDPLPAVIVCHPHPLYGGEMSNNVVMAICRVLAAQSIAAFRFNFRGAGDSQGTFGNGIGEREDIKAAVSLVSSAAGIDRSQIGLAGYSFGASVAIPVALDDSRINLLALISPALTESGWEQLRRITSPKLIISGSNDYSVPAKVVQNYTSQLPEPKQCFIVSGADHFWWGYEDEMAQKVSQFFTDGFSQLLKDN